MLENQSNLVGAAKAQVNQFVKQVDALVAENPEAAAYSPGAIL
jgi:hypothetical protein